MRNAAAERSDLNLTGSTAGGVEAHTAIGSGKDAVTNVESVVGSPFDDEIIAPEGVANQHLYGGMGSDSCTPGPCEEPARSLTGPFAYLDTYSPFATEATPDPALIAVGGSAGETFTLSNSGASFTVTAAVEGSAEELATDESCSTPSRGTVSCSLEATPVGGAQTWFGGAGDDALTAEGTGGDSLYADAGNDQLVTTNPCQSHVFHGGEGQDVAGFARTVPGSGEVPGVGEYGINATLGDPSAESGELGSSYYGHAYVLGEGGTGNICSGGAYTWVGGDSEILEGTKKWDVLIGNEAANTIWGRRGNDTIWGLGGADLIEGHEGDDTVYGGNDADTIHGNAGDDTLEGNSGTDTIHGGSGNDLIHGNAGNDTLYGEDGADTVWGDESVDSLYGNAGSDKLRAKDETRDTTVNCGEGIDEPTAKDSYDPVVNCE